MNQQPYQREHEHHPKCEIPMSHDGKCMRWAETMCGRAHLVPVGNPPARSIAR